MSEKIERMKAWFKREQEDARERHRKRSEKVAEVLKDVERRARKDADGKPILFYSSRAHRRGGMGQPRSTIFSEKMAIPKTRKR